MILSGAWPFMTLPAFIVVTLIASSPGWAVASFVASQDPAAQASLPQATTPNNQPAAISFSSNGCSGFREARFFSCCFVHDLAYWAGGTRADRTTADRALWRCVFDISGERIAADIGYLLVRLGAIPGRFIKDGWGRAWYDTNRSRFAPLTRDQQQWVDAERTRVCQSLKLNLATGWYLVDEKREIRARQAREVCRGDPPVRR